VSRIVAMIRKRRGSGRVAIPACKPHRLHKSAAVGQGLQNRVAFRHL